VTPTASADKTPEQIEREMERTRESLTAKVEALEHQVVGTVQTAADTLSETVETVKSFVENAPAAVSDSVKHAAEAVGETVRQTFDISGHVRRNPWAAVGSAALLGCVTAWFLSGRRGSSGSAAADGYSSGGAGPVSAHALSSEGPSRSSGLFGELWGMVESKGKEMARTALESVSAAVKESIQEHAPKLVSEAASRLTGDGTPAGSSAAHVNGSRAGV
jgi:ElaB/YqjD/DUF883 family membrane-anchored ribosome-binding protein